MTIWFVIAFGVAMLQWNDNNKMYFTILVQPVRSLRVSGWGGGAVFFEAQAAGLPPPRRNLRFLPRRIVDRTGEADGSSPHVAQNERLASGKCVCSEESAESAVTRYR